MKYFDAHCHVQFDAYDEDRDAVLASMREAAVGGVIVGTDRTTSRLAVKAADGVTLFASIGLHPNDKPGEGFDDAYYAALATDPKVVAIGECGLDYFRPENPEAEKARQKDVFARHLALAKSTDKPLIIHARPSKGSMDAYEDALDMIEAEGGLSGDFHFFVGDVATAKRIVALGFTVSYTAVLTFTNDYDEVVRSLPLESMLAETDAPYVAPAPNRGKRNTPLATIDVVSAIARIRGEDEGMVRETLLRNAERVFGISLQG